MFTINFQLTHLNATRLLLPVGYNIYQLNVDAFRFCCVISTFQCITNTVFFNMLDNTIIIYLSDILTYNRHIELHCKTFKAVLQCLAWHKLYLYSDKYALLLLCAKLLGHVIYASGVKVQL